MAGLVAVAGCGSGREGQVEVTGQVTVDGTPLTTGRIEFFPESGRPAGSEIDSEGRYRLSTYEPGDGVKPGKYVVTVTAREVPDDGPVYNSLEDEMRGVRADTGSKRASQSGPARVKWLAPQKYSNRASSDLTAEIEGDKEINFALQTKN